MLLMFFGIIVIVVGLYEIFVNKNMWVNLNITELWTKKGLNLQPGGLPTNFYSSETINGERIRRMTSTFADPVNLGTFLFSIFCLNWFHGNKKGFILTLFAIILTVSKGALVGLLIFACIYAFVYHRKKFIYIALSMFALGVSFLVYAYITSANSVFLHISGLLSAFSILGTKPFGYGLGSVGVLSQQFSDVTANYSITETGLGMIIGQLGIIGLSIYLLYFIYIIFKCFKLNDKKEKVLCCTFILSILVNILFNEVALSPNSCAIYFIIVGYYLGMENNRKEKKDERFN